MNCNSVTLIVAFYRISLLQGVRLRVCESSPGLNPSILVRFLHDMAHFKGKAWPFVNLSRNFTFCAKLFVGFESRGFS